LTAAYFGQSSIFQQRPADYSFGFEIRSLIGLSSSIRPGVRILPSLGALEFNAAKQTFTVSIYGKTSITPVIYFL
jgi:hypothetical protein